MFKDPHIRKLGPVFYLYMTSAAITTILSVSYLVCWIVGMSVFQYPLFLWDIICINPLAYAAGIFSCVCIMEWFNESATKTRFACNVLALLAIICAIGFTAGALGQTASMSWRCILDKEIIDAAAAEICAQAKTWTFVFWILLFGDMLVELTMFAACVSSVYSDIFIVIGRVKDPRSILPLPFTK